jgi:16S rRNA (guanine527-N7)-methyltransferase
MNLDIFVEELRKINIKISDKQILQLEKYYELLIEWNQKINLTTITNKEEVYLKHFYDSLTIIKGINPEKIATLADVGTGAGFPGLVIKILFPKIRVVLIDALNKRINFLNIIIKELDLKNVETVHSRIEEYGKNNRELFDVTTARAVSNTRTLLEFLTPLTKVNGYIILMKGNINEELKEAKQAIRILDLKMVNKQEFNLPVENSQRTIIVFQKLSTTNNKYPRLYSQIKNNPL